jgi:hypothetical protein
MSISIKDYHKKPTYDELIREAVIHPTETIKYPNRIATQLRTTPQLTRFDDESFLDMNTINSNAAKQNIQQTAVQKALQPIPRPIPAGVEQFDIADTEEAIIEQVDEAAASYERYKEKQAKKQARLVSISEEELAKPGQIDDMMASSAAAASGDIFDFTAITPIIQSYEEQTTRNLRGSSMEPRFKHRRQHSSSTIGSSSAAAEQFEDVSFEDVPFEEEEKTLITKDIKIDELQELARYRIMELNNRGSTSDHKKALELKTLMWDIEKLRAKTHVKDKTQSAITEYSSLKKKVIDILNGPL